MAYATTDGPPPSPATDPAAARETGQPMPIQNLAQPMSLSQSQGPDLSGVLKLFEKTEQAIITLTQVAPMISTQLEQARSILMNAAGMFVTQASGTGTSSSMPLTPGATGQVVTQAGAQFPGAVGPKPF